MEQTKSFHTTENMERISRQHLCDNLDSILETVSLENIGFVITDAGKDDLVRARSRIGKSEEIF